MTTIPDLDKEGKFFVFNLALSEFQFILDRKGMEEKLTQW